MTQHLAGHGNEPPVTEKSQNGFDSDGHHPLTMEVQSTLADIFLAHARPYEALDTASALWKQAKRTLGEHHPQTLKYCYQLGGIELYIGNYVRSVELLQSVYDEANAKWGGPKLTDDKETRGRKRRRLENAVDQESDKMSAPGQDPDVLNYLSKLAMANHCLGNVDMAKNQSRRAVTGLVDIYSGAWINTHDRDIIDILKKLGFTSKDGQTMISHPDVLESLANFVEIFKNERDWRQAGINALGMIYEKNKDCRGPHHPVSLWSGLVFGLAKLDDGADMDDIADHFQRLSEDCERYLGADHITTLRASLGELFLGLFKFESRLFKAKLRTLAPEIMDKQTRSLGDYHPLVMDSLTRLFALELMVDSSNAHGRAKKILDKLRQPAIREQRLMESLKCETKIADLYYTAKKYEHSLPIYKSILDVLEMPIIREQGNRLKWLDGRVQSFKKTVDKSLQRARADAEARYSVEVEKANKARDVPDLEGTEVAQRRVSTLAKVLYGERDSKAIDAVRQLAADLGKMEDQHKRLEGAAILGELLSKEAQEDEAE
ncbi:hypothetical protein B0I35DRAFT_179770 [Stachybotrys elegans]|uniref:Uncharacterized protein n=1 Tax=Stachybotrys elegans TaxID=80388 RepID=A0A8K0SBM7_9HYPO|nr:hypothetical protein B0I35DRAFT_179770 [Stachybotrys elegans]